MRGRAYNKNVGLMKPLSLIVAVDETGGFGKDGKIPWNHPEDFKHFQSITKDAACIMGRHTYLDAYDIVIARRSKGKKKDKPVKIKELLPGRDCYVVTRQKTLEGVTAVPNIRTAVNTTDRNNIFVIGGERMYNESLPWVNKIYMTLIKGTYDCDRFFPVEYLTQYFKIIKGEKGSDSTLFIEYQRNRV